MFWFDHPFSFFYFLSLLSFLFLSVYHKYQLYFLKSVRYIHTKQIQSGYQEHKIEQCSPHLLWHEQKEICTWKSKRPSHFNKKTQILKQTSPIAKMVNQFSFRVLKISILSKQSLQKSSCTSILIFKKVLPASPEFWKIFPRSSVRN